MKRRTLRCRNAKPAPAPASLALTTCGPGLYRATYFPSLLAGVFSSAHVGHGLPLRCNRLVADECASLREGDELVHGGAVELWRNRLFASDDSHQKEIVGCCLV